jgi:hypothetical protein
MGNPSQKSVEKTVSRPPDMEDFVNLPFAI